jgi:DNA-binding transcriptional LysR family regulator
VQITLDHARALDALDRHGTFHKAAAALHVGHTSVLYALRTLEDQLELRVLDRSGYRTKLTPAGRRVLERCRALLAAEADLAATVDELRGGWEPTVKVVFDGIVPIEPLLHAVGELARERVPTRIDVRAEFLGAVEDTFVASAADLMISVLPPRETDLCALGLPVIKATLVAHRKHPLASGTHDIASLRRHVLLTVRGGDPRLELPTSGLEQHATVLLNDFASKRAAIAAGIGFGWLPDAMISGELSRVRWSGASTHRFHPRLFHRGHPGRAAQRLISALR